MARVPLVLNRWAAALRSCNVPDVRGADFVSRWLVASRSCVLSMTLTSALIGILLALARGPISVGASVIATLGLLAAHASNNLLNDLIDSRLGVDTPEYPRARYSVHPILGGLATPRGVLAGAAALTALDAGAMVWLAILRGWPVLVFAGSGFAASLAYTGILKRWALGELTSMIVWGPLMIGGTAFVASGRWDPSFLLGSLPYGVAVASVLVGKHVDKLQADRDAGVRSLAVVLGERRSLALGRGLFMSFYLLAALLVALRVSGLGILVSLVAVYRLARSWRAYARPRPEAAPSGWPIWPLWYVGWAMYFNRLAGALYVAGLVLNVLFSRLLVLAAAGALR